MRNGKVAAAKAPPAVTPANPRSSAPADRATADVIVTRGLTKVFAGGHTAVDGLDLAVREGEIFALLGPNGAGKTTTVGMLTARVVPTAGTATVKGVDVATNPRLAKAAIGVVSQVNTLDRNLNVQENLYFHARYFGMRDSAAKEAVDRQLERFRLRGRAKDGIPSLSGGVAKRVMLARAFLPGPAVLFLDEPTAGLDPQSRLVLWEILGELHAEGQTIFLTTHHLEEADRLAQRVAIMDRGRLLALDTAEQLRRAHGGGWILVLRVDGDLDRLARRLERLPEVIEAYPSIGEVRVRLEQADEAVADIVAMANREGFFLRSVFLEAATLETIFLALTGTELRE